MTSVATTPRAALSVGVDQPATIAPTTTPKIESSGSTYWKNGLNRSHPWKCSYSVAGASEGFIVERSTIQATNPIESRIPGTIPPISKPEIEMLARLPSRTDNALGGISMSTAPIAMIGPVAMVG